MNRIVTYDGSQRKRFQTRVALIGAAAVLCGAMGISGCASAGSRVASTAGSLPAGSSVIIEGDQLSVSFTGAPSMDTTQEVRRDGRISLPLIGEAVAAGLTPQALGQQLTQQYASELIANEVRVTVLASQFNVNVSGAVLRPGRYASKRPLTALEAVMEAGGFDHAKADIKRVVVVRHHNGAVNNFVLDLSLALSGKPSEPFYLQPSDIVFVPTRFVWF